MRFSFMYTATNMCPQRKPVKPTKHKNEVIQLKAIKTFPYYFHFKNNLLISC